MQEEELRWSGSSMGSHRVVEGLAAALEPVFGAKTARQDPSKECSKEHDAHSHWGVVESLVGDWVDVRQHKDDLDTSALLSAYCQLTSARALPGWEVVVIRWNSLTLTVCFTLRHICCVSMHSPPF
jgi:hypothetical protein